MLDLDIGAGHHHFLDAFDGGDLDEAVALVRQQGIGGSFLDTDHTAAHFRQRLWVPRVFAREKTKDPREAPDPVRIAYERWTNLLARTPPYVLPDDQAREIDRIVARARKTAREQSWKRIPGLRSGGHELPRRAGLPAGRNVSARRGVALAQQSVRARRRAET